jgi:rubrerythrin
MCWTDSDAELQEINDYRWFRKIIETTKPVTPKYTDEEIDKAQAVEQAYVDKMVELAVKETKRPKGKWIEVLEHRDEFGSTWHYECSECGARSYKGFTPLERYCPNCGAEMSGGGKDE